NFMIRDQRMQQLIAKDQEPITPFVDKIRQLYSGFNVSTILVMGGSGDYFEHADHVIGLDNYTPRDYTEEAHQIARMKNENRNKEGGDSFGEITPRYPVGKSIRADKGKKQKNIKVRGRHIIQFGTQTIDLAALEQIVDSSQTEAIADAIYYARKYMDGHHTIKEIIDKVKEDVSLYGLNRIGGNNAGNYAQFRPFELAAAINRLRTLQVKN
ncbi:MAG: P-loop domain-containing protein, partial [Bacteroidota bacterium]